MKKGLAFILGLVVLIAAGWIVILSQADKFLEAFNVTK
jgi:hypothetical protein